MENVMIDDDFLCRCFVSCRSIFLRASAALRTICCVEEFSYTYARTYFRATNSMCKKLAPT
jgi:hypothetical protein